MSYVYDFIDRNTKDLQKLGGGGRSGKNYGSSLGIGAGLKLQDLKFNFSLADPVNAVLGTGQQVAKDLGINTDQDLTKVDITGGHSLNLDQTLPDNTPNWDQLKPNLDQDLSRISVRGLQEELVKRGDQVQQELIKIGTAGQEALVQAGKAAQEQAVRAGAAMQENAVQFGKNISGGQRNELLEHYANQLTKGGESQAAQVTKYAEEKVIPLVGDIYATAYGDKNPAVKFVQGAVRDAEGNTGGIEALPTDFANFNIDLANLVFGDDDGSSGGQVTTGDNLAPAPTLDDPGVIPEMEQATTKAGQMTEEERLRRMRRLLLNRYGREDTILSGGGDTKSRRRYAL